MKKLTLELNNGQTVDVAEPVAEQLARAHALHRALNLGDDPDVWVTRLLNDAITRTERQARQVCLANVGVFIGEIRRRQRAGRFSEAEAGAMVESLTDAAGELVKAELARGAQR